jgi:hypothetical protein
LIQWGKTWAHYFKLYTEMVEEGREARVLRPKTFSETKMANHAKDVYSRFREIIPALLITLEDVKLEWSSSCQSSDGAEKAQKANAVMGKVYNATFLLSLSALVDIYAVYSSISNNFQVVNILAFDRKDIFDKELEKMETMLSIVSVADCCCSFFYDYEEGVYREDEWGKEKDVELLCQWPVLHRDIREVLGKSSYPGLPIGCLAEEGSKTRAGANQTLRVMVLDVGKAIDTVNKRAHSVVTFLHSGLSNRVYSSYEVIVINNIRRLLDLKYLVKIIEQYGAASVSTTRWRNWLDAAKFFEIDLFSRVSADELRVQFRDFLARLGELAPTLVGLDNTEIFGIFLNRSLPHYKHIESVLGIMAKAALVMGLESVVESWVSVLEHHNNPQRPLTQVRLEQEGMIAINGPADVHCDAVVEEALSSYWGKQKVAGNRGGHWIRRGDSVKSYTISEAVDSIVNKTPSVPFMC